MSVSRARVYFIIAIIVVTVTMHVQATHVTVHSKRYYVSAVDSDFV